MVHKSGHSNMDKRVQTSVDKLIFILVLNSCIERIQINSILKKRYIFQTIPFNVKHKQNVCKPRQKHNKIYKNWMFIIHLSEIYLYKSVLALFVTYDYVMYLKRKNINTRLIKEKNHDTYQVNVLVDKMQIFGVFTITMRIPVVL